MGTPLSALNLQKNIRPLRKMAGKTADKRQRTTFYKLDKF